MPSHPLRGAAAIVGVADEVAPSGMIDGSLRSIEARMVRAALDDAGLTLARRGRRVHQHGPRVGPVDGAGRVPRHPGPLDRLHPDGRLELRDPRRARRRGHRARSLRRCGERLREHAPVGPQAARWRPLPQPSDDGRHAHRRVGAALRDAHAARRLRARGQPAHGRVRHDLRAARADRGEHPRVGGHEPPGPVPGPDHRRRRARVTARGVAAAQARLLPRHRRCRRGGDDRAPSGPATWPSRRSWSSAPAPATPTT